MWSVHSTTKYLNGHSDVLGGILVLDDDAMAEEIRFIRKSTGPVPGPMDSWLTLRGTKTLHVRMERHNENGMRIAEFLEADPMVRARCTTRGSLPIRSTTSPAAR